MGALIVYFFKESGYRSAGSDTVQIKCWICHSSGTVVVVKQTRLHQLYKWFSIRLSQWRLSFW